MKTTVCILLLAAAAWAQEVAVPQGGSLGPSCKLSDATTLGADKLDGSHSSATPAANTVPVADSNGKLAPGWIPLPTGNSIGGIFMSADCLTGNHVSGIDPATGQLRCAADTADWSNIGNKPSAFPPDTNSQAWQDLLAALASKAPSANTALSGTTTAEQIVAATSVQVGSGTPAVNFSYGTSAPTGACTAGMYWRQVSADTVAEFYCKGGSWTASGPGADATTLQGRALDSTAPAANQFLGWLGSSWGPSGITSTQVSGLGDSATKNVGTATGTVAAGDDSRITGALPKSGGTMTGTLVLVGNPSVTNDASNKGYVDTQIATRAPTASPTFTGTVSGITKSMVGLGNVDNTADTAKPVSTAQQTALDAKLNTSALDTDTALTADSDAKIASQKATKAYADTKALSGAAADFSVSAVGSSTTTPRIFGVSGTDGSSALRSKLGDFNNSLQTGSGQRLQLFSYYGIDIHGTHRTNYNSTPPVFATGTNTDPELNVLSTKTDTANIRATRVASQTADLFQGTQEDNATHVFRVDSSGQTYTPQVNLTGSGPGTFDFQAGSGSCPAKTAAHVYGCYQNNRLEVSNNGEDYAPVIDSGAAFFSPTIAVPASGGTWAPSGITGNRIYLFPFHLPFRVSATRISIAMPAAPTGSPTCDVAILSTAGSRLLAGGGWTTSSGQGTNVIKTTTFTAVVLQPGDYYEAYACSATDATLTITSPNVGAAWVGLFNQGTATVGYSSDTATAGVIPATVSVTVNSGQTMNPPLARIQ